MQKLILYFHKANDYTGSTRALATAIGTKNARVITLNVNGEGFLSEMKNVVLIPVMYPQLKGHNIPIVTFIVSYISRIVQTIKESKNVNVFYINTITPFYAAIIGRLLGKEIVYHIHEKIINPSLVYRIAEYIFNNTPSKTIYVSKYLSECYPKKIGDYSVIYNRLPENFLSKVCVRPIEERSRTQILMISSLSKEKGVDMFYKIASMLPELNFVLVLSVGKEAITKYFGEDLPKNLTIYSRQKELSSFYQNADLLVNLTQPSLCVETFGMTILEAMPYGVPAIVPNEGGPKELVYNAYNGYRVNVENSGEIVDAILKSLEKENYSTLVYNTLNRYKELYG